jgi:hypothetical protein
MRVKELGDVSKDYSTRYYKEGHHMTPKYGQARRLFS